MGPDVVKLLAQAVTDPIHRSIDIGERLAARLDRQVGEIDVDRESGQVADEQIDRSPTLQSEAFLLRDEGEHTHEQHDLPAIEVIERHRGPPAR